MVCLECGRVVKSINYRHLRFCCGLTPSEYVSKHPGAKLLDEEIRKLLGSPGEKNPKWKGGMDNRVCEGCGTKISKHAFVIVCRKCSIKRSGNPFAGKQHTEETRKKMSAAAEKRDPSTYKYGIAPSEDISKRQKERWMKIPEEDRASMLTSFIEAGQAHNKKSSRTRIENIVDELLQSITRNYERNAQIGRFNVDFLIESKYIIECYGDFWHCNPKLYQINDYNKSLHMTSEEKWRKDKMRINKLNELGYVTVILWESDIRNDPEKTAQIIHDFLHANKII